MFWIRFTKFQKLELTDEYKLMIDVMLEEENNEKAAYVSYKSIKDMFMPEWKKMLEYARIGVVKPMALSILIAPGVSHFPNYHLVLFGATLSIQ